MLFPSKIFDSQFIKNIVMNRTVEIKLFECNSSCLTFEVKTLKIHKPDYVSCVLRNQDDFYCLEEHVNKTYGGLIIPVLSKQSQNLDEIRESYQIYLKELLQNKTIRNDKIIFGFFFFQEQKNCYRTKYQRFLTHSLQLSRKYFNQLFTRQDIDYKTKYDIQLQNIRQTINEKKIAYEQLNIIVNRKSQQQMNLFSVLNQLNILCSNYLQDKSQILFLKNQKILTIFQQIEGAYHRRMLFKQHVKQLKADMMKHKYNSNSLCTSQIFWIQKNKLEECNQILFKQMKSNIVILDSLIREIMRNYAEIERSNYSTQIKI